MLKVIFSFIWKIFSSAFIIWVVLSTVIPVILHRLSMEPNGDIIVPSLTLPKKFPITESLVYFVISHPDDEVMFFSPTVLEVTKSIHKNNVKLICLSKGDAVSDSFGTIRSHELLRSAEILGIPRENVTIFDKFKDGMNIRWESTEIKKELDKIVEVKSSQPIVYITFDKGGISQHTNHISAYYGLRYFLRSWSGKHSSEWRLFSLKTTSFWDKYSFTLLTNLELLVNLVSKAIVTNILKIKVKISFFNSRSPSQSIKIYSNLNMLTVSYAAMSYGHYSQMTWFRYGWLLLSRYLTFNQLDEVK